MGLSGKLCSRKKMLQITSRIFIDDLNKALEKNRKTVHIGTALETPEEVELLKKYSRKFYY
jgi:hypothetical protein